MPHARNTVFEGFGGRPDRPVGPRRAGNAVTGYVGFDKELVTILKGHPDLHRRTPLLHQIRPAISRFPQPSSITGAKESTGRTLRSQHITGITWLRGKTLLTWRGVMFREYPRREDSPLKVFPGSGNALAPCGYVRSALTFARKAERAGSAATHLRRAQDPELHDGVPNLLIDARDP